VDGERDVSVGRALELARALAVATGAEAVPVAEAAGRTLAEDVRAARDVPAADGSAMDGWAVRAADTPGPLRPVGESAAGRAFAGALGPGEAVAISTGAVLPRGADAVARHEVVSVDDGVVRVRERLAPGRDARSAGELIRAGEVLLAAGARVAPHEVGAIGAVGLATVRCARRPHVAILATGAELVPLGAPARPDQVHDSSRHGIAAQASAAGAVVVATATVGDEREATVRALEKLLASGADLVVTTGGISAGAHDHVRPALALLAVDEVARGVRAAPIRPTWLGRIGARAVLGLPGNPASAAVAFHVLGRPLLGAPEDWWRRAPLTVAAATRPGRAELLRCREGPDGLTPMAHQGPHAITSLAGARALAWLPEEGDGVRAGEPVAFSRLA
jgi:molybdopterin molybdotransferase